MILLQVVNDPCDSCGSKENVRELRAVNQKKNDSYHLHLCINCLGIVAEMVEDDKPSFQMDEAGNLHPTEQG